MSNSAQSIDENGFQVAAQLFQTSCTDTRLANAYYDSLIFGRTLTRVQNNGLYAWVPEGVNPQASMSFLTKEFTPDYCNDPRIAIEQLPDDIANAITIIIQKEPDGWAAKCSASNGDYYALVLAKTHREALCRAYMALACLHRAYPPENAQEQNHG